LNESEACFLSDALTGVQQAGATIRDLNDATLMAVSLQARGIARVAITLGRRGAVLAYNGTSVHVPAPAVQVVDTTAAGDCFTGAFTVALTEQQEPAAALRFAVYASALKVTKFGAQFGLPMRSEVETLLRSM
jgi:ribokinase